MTSGKRKTLKIMLIAAAVMAAAFAVTALAAGAAFNNEIALLEHLDDKDFSPAAAKRLIESFSALKTGEDIVYSAHAFNVIDLIASLGEDGLGEAYAAYNGASGIKNPFMLLKYASVYDSAKDLPVMEDNIKDLPVMEDNIFEGMPEDHIRAFLEEVGAVASKISGKGADKYYENAETIYTMFTTPDFTEILSYKSILNAADYFVDVTEDVDPRNLYIMDVFFGSGFTATHREGMESVFAVLRNTDREELIDAVMYMPIEEKVFVALSRLAAEEALFDIEAFSLLAVSVLEILEPETTITSEFVSESIRYAAELDPDYLTDEESARLSDILARFDLIIDVGADGSISR